MKCVCICCFDHYATRMRSIIDFFKSKDFDTKYIISDYQHYGKYRFKAEYDNTIQIHVPEYKKNMSANRIISHLIFSKTVYKELRHIQPDIIFCNFPPNSLVKEVLKYKKKNVCKVIMDCYDLWPESFPYTKFNSLLKIPFGIWKSFRDKYINNSDIVTCVSEDAKTKLTSMGIDVPIKVINPIIISDNLPTYNFDVTESISLCYLGHINHVTDVELCIRLLGELAKVKKITLHHIGKGQNQETLYESLKASGVNVISHGVVFDQIEKSKIYSLCDFGLNIPREEIHSSMALKSLEYMLVGLPIINAGVGDIRNIIETAQLGINIDRSDIKKCVGMICSVNKTDLIQYHKNCIKYYNEVICKQNIDGVFDSILCNKEKI